MVTFPATMHHCPLAVCPTTCLFYYITCDAFNQTIWLCTICQLLSVDRLKLIFYATRINLLLHCSTTARRKRATDDELVVLDKGLMTEALEAGQTILEQVGDMAYIIVLITLLEQGNEVLLLGCLSVSLSVCVCVCLPRANTKLTL